MKIYLDASEEVRAKRRYLEELEKGIQTTYEDVLESIRLRDERDKNKKVGALKKADDAITIDTSDLSIEQVTEKVKQLIQEKM